MALTNREAMPEQLQAHTLILNHSLSVARSFSLKCAIQLGLADIIHKHGAPMPLSELARCASIPPEKEAKLQRLMRLLTFEGVFGAEKRGLGGEETAYTLTPISTLVLKEGTNKSAHVLVMLDEVLMKPWHFLSDWLRTKGSSDSSPFQLAYNGLCFWELTSTRPEINDMFNEAMACETRWLMKEIVTQYPGVFRGLKSLVDVGGGTGTSARIIAEAFPEIKCTVFDLPHVIATMPETKGIDAVGGDMFNYIPPANAIFLKNILHDWNDEHCIKVLQRCKEAIPSKEKGGKVIITDIVVDPQNNNSKLTETHLFFDMCMMTGADGKEREECEWRNVFNAAGFKDYRIFPTKTMHSIIEVYP